MEISCIICGFGNVGRALARLIEERRSLLQERYGMCVVCHVVIAGKGAAVSSGHLPLADIAGFVEGGSRLDTHPEFGRKGFGVKEAVSQFEPGVLFEVTPTNIKTGEPGLTHFKLGIGHGWHIVSANKGPLVSQSAELKKAAKNAGIQMKFSGATAAALPTIDVGLTCLAGSSISKIEGIMTGTTNLLLTRMAESGKSYHEALREAQKIGIAETDPSLDVEGWDTANKILILANTLMDCDLKLNDLSVSGITELEPEYVQKVKAHGKEIKLLGVVEKIDENIDAYVKPTIIDGTHPLFGVNGTEKGITFTTDTLGTITVTGGRAGPVGTSAALLKDVINIYR